LSFCIDLNVVFSKKEGLSHFLQQPPFPVRLLFGAADTQLIGKLDVTGMVFFGKVSEELLAQTDHGEQTAAGAVILEVALQVFGEFGDACAQESDLHFGGTGITLFAGILLDDFSFDCFVHFFFLSVLRVPQQSFPDK
jgi:hypothetical protein